MKSTKLFFAAGVIAALTACSGEEQQQQAPAPEIATMTISLGTSELNHTYPATIKGKTDIAIRPQVTAFITKVNVEEGQQVKKDQVLFTLDQVTFQQAVNTAQANVDAAQEMVNTAQIKADSDRKLFDKNIISEYAWQMSDNSLRQAQAQLAQAQAQLVSAQKNLSYTIVTSPSDGVVGTIPSREGSLVSPSSQLTTVSENDQVYAYFSLNEKDLLGLTQNGTKSLEQSISEMPEVQLQLANGEIYPSKGKISTVSGVIDAATGAASVRAIFDNPSGMLRSGSTGKVLIPQVTENAIIIPQKATSELQDRRFAYLVNDSNKVVQTPITVDALNDGVNFVVTSGLKASDRIVIEGVGNAVRPGMVISPVAPKAN